MTVHPVSEAAATCDQLRERLAALLDKRDTALAQHAPLSHRLAEAVADDDTKQAAALRAEIAEVRRIADESGEAERVLRQRLADAVGRLFCARVDELDAVTRAIAERADLALAELKRLPFHEAEVRVEAVVHEERVLYSLLHDAFHALGFEPRSCRARVVHPSPAMAERAQMYVEKWRGRASWPPVSRLGEKLAACAWSLKPSQPRPRVDSSPWNALCLALAGGLNHE